MIPNKLNTCLLCSVAVYGTEVQNKNFTASKNISETISTTLNMLTHE